MKPLGKEWGRQPGEVRSVCERANPFAVLIADRADIARWKAIRYLPLSPLDAPSEPGDSSK